MPTTLHCQQPLSWARSTWPKYCLAGTVNHFFLFVKNLFTVQTRSDVDVNLQDQLGYTALHWAAIKGNDDLARALLINKNSDPNLRSKSLGMTPLHASSCVGYDVDTYYWGRKRRRFNYAWPSRSQICGWDIITKMLLLRNDTSANIEDATGRSALHCAIEKRRYKAAKVLAASEKVDVNARGPENVTALHLILKDIGTSEEITCLCIVFWEILCTAFTCNSGTRHGPTIIQCELCCSDGNHLPC